MLFRSPWSPYHGEVASVAFRILLGTDKLESGDEMEFEYIGASMVLRVSPERGAVTGGTLVSVQGSGFTNAGVQCRFGSMTVLGRGAMLMSSSLVHCTAPPSESFGEVMVEVSMNGGADFTSNGKKFVYEQGATSTALQPSAGRSGLNDHVVTVVGRHFEATNHLRCRIGHTHVPARLMTSSTIVCSLPARGEG